MSGSHPIEGPPISTTAHKDAIGRLLSSIFVFILPAVKFIEITIGGKLFFTEIILLILFMFMLVTRKIHFQFKLAHTFILLCLLWLYGQIFTDLIRGTPLVDYARGWAKILFTIINFTVLFILLHGKKRRMVIFASGLVTGGFLEYFLNPGPLALTSPWKFALGTPVTLLVVLIVSAISPSKPFVRIGLLMAAFAINMCMGFRSLSGICFLTAIYLFIQSIEGRKRLTFTPHTFKRPLVVGTFLLVASMLLIEGYGYMAQQGILGERAENVYQMQGYGMLGVLIGGRSEILSSGRAILDSPIIGHGSWAKDPKYVDALIMYKRQLGYYADEQDESELIPTHSHFFGAWVEAGILGAAFWGWVLCLVARCLYSMYGIRDRLVPLYAFIGFFLLWDIFFSPYAGDRRFITVFYIVTLMTAITEFTKSRKKSFAL